MGEFTALKIHAADAGAVGAVTTVTVLGIEARAVFDIGPRIVFGMALQGGFLGGQESG